MEPERELSQRLNPARRLELLLEALLGQRLYSVEFAWAFTVLERHLRESRRWLECLEQLSDDESSVRERTLSVLSELGEAMQEVRRFAEEGELGALDRGLAGARRARFPLDEMAARADRVGGPIAFLRERIWSDSSADRPWQEAWDATVSRHRGETRVTFACKTCGWDFTYVAEAGSAEELEVPFSELECPFCSPAEGS
ncbi:MAG: hypothetical protein HY319_08795 [Armatimonadetes bacterium]|nr:hypothetical protein [Armatimonadota bacterium]